MNTRTKRLLREESGFTLPEMLVTMVIMLTVLFALYNIFDMGIRVFRSGSDKVEAVENARLGLEKMEREIRAAYPYNKAGGNTTLLPGFSSSSITFGNDLNGNRIIDTTNEQITYSLSGGSPPALLRNGQSTSEFVKANGLTFQYLDKNNNTTNTESNITRVRISLDVEVDRGSFGKRTQTLTTDVALRNRGS